MTGLLDIAPSANTVLIQGTDINVVGVSAMGVVHLLTKFPELKKLMDGKDAGITVERLLDMAPEAISSVIAAGTGQPGNAKVKAVADGLPIGDQVDLLEAILKATLPDGLGPFVAKLSKLTGVLGGNFAGGGKAPATK